MKRLLALILAIFLLISCAACGKVVVSRDTSRDETTDPATQTQAPQIADDPQLPDDETQSIKNLIVAEEYQQAYDQLIAIETPTLEQAELLKGFHYQLVEEKKDDGSILYTYDSRGNLIHKVNNIWDEEYTYTYDEKDNILIEEYHQVEYSSKIENVYDQNGMLIEFFYSDNDSANSHYTYSYVVDQNGNVLEMHTSSHYDSYTWKDVYTYDENGNLLTEENYAGGELISTHTYTYDAKGNMLTKDTSSIYGFENTHITYTYDENGNLLTEEESADDYTLYCRTYTYDENGNVLTLRKEDTEGVYNHTYTYDENGNMSKEVVECNNYYDASTSTYTTSYTWQLFYNPNLASEKEAA